MAEIKEFQSKPDVFHTDSLESFENLKEHLSSGQIKSFAWILTKRDGTITTQSTCESSMELIGIIETMKYYLLSEIEE